MLCATANQRGIGVVFTWIISLQDKHENVAGVYKELADSPTTPLNTPKTKVFFGDQFQCTVVKEAVQIRVGCGRVSAVARF